MNRDGHLISSMLILITVMAASLIYLLIELGALRVVITTIFSVVVFLWGCLLPDLDHPKVHEKIFFLRWLGKVTHHRGHFHSIIASLVYGGIIFLIVFLLNLYYWIFPIVFGIAGFCSHLIEDDLNRYKLKSKPKRGFKLF